MTLSARLAPHCSVLFFEQRIQSLNDVKKTNVNCLETVYEIRINAYPTNEISF